MHLTVSDKVNFSSAPEVLEGLIDAASDIYSLGVFALKCSPPSAICCRTNASAEKSLGNRLSSRGLARLPNGVCLLGKAMAAAPGRDMQQPEICAPPILSVT